MKHAENTFAVPRKKWSIKDVLDRSKINMKELLILEFFYETIIPNRAWMIATNSALGAARSVGYLSLHIQRALEE